MSPTATMRPTLAPLQTPQSASFPSEICSTPLSAYPFSSMAESLRTPITPPTAYTDFLKALTPVLASPPPSALNRTSSSDSSNSTQSVPNTGTSSTFSLGNGRSILNTTEGNHKSPVTALPPPTPLSASYAQQRRASLKRLRIPTQHSPLFSPATASATPRTAGVTSAIYSPFSPADWNNQRLYDNLSTPRSACSKPVSVRSVVTRTVTYKRATPHIDPAPKGKRRKLADDGASVTSSSMASHSRETSVSSISTATQSDRENDTRSPVQSPAPIKAEHLETTLSTRKRAGSTMMPPPLISIKQSSPDAAAAAAIKEEEMTIKQEDENATPIATVAPLLPLGVATGSS